MENEVMKPASWSSQLCLKKSEWLAQNVKGLDQRVKDMLLLIDGDFSVETAEGDNPKQSELIACIKEISYRHNLLADHYNKLTGELNGHVQSENGMKNYEKAAFDPQQTPPFKTAHTKLEMLNADNELVGSDLFQSSGGGVSDMTPNESSESFLLSSDSDSESYNSSPKKGGIDQTEQERSCDAKNGECRECEMLLSEISDHVKELGVSTDKLHFAEEEIAKLKSELQNNAAVMVNLGSLEDLLAAAKNQIKLHEAEMDKENQRSLGLQGHIVDLEAKLEAEQRHAMDLQEIVTQYTVDLSNRDLEIQKLSSDLQDATANFASEKWQMESSVSKLSESLEFHKARTMELQVQHDSLANEIRKYKAEKIEMEEKHEAQLIKWQHDIEHMKEELSKKSVHVDILNETLDGLKLKLDMLMAEKDGVNAKLQNANAELSVCDDQIKNLEHNLHKLDSERKLLIANDDTAHKQIAELKSRIDELEKEVGMQASKTNVVAEEKREAIRQLCFSIDHFRSAYEEVRDAYISRRQPTTLVA